MHKVWGNYTSCIGRSNENICSSSGGAQVNGKRGSKQDETQAHFTLWVWANVQPESSIPIDGKVKISPKGFTRGVKAELEKSLFNLPQVTNKSWVLWACIGPKAGKRIPSNLGAQFATLGANVWAFINILTSMF
jgi:hypothetical protein